MGTVTEVIRFFWDCRGQGGIPPGGAAGAVAFQDAEAEGWKGRCCLEGDAHLCTGLDVKCACPRQLPQNGPGTAAQGWEEQG